MGIGQFEVGKNDVFVIINAGMRVKTSYSIFYDHVHDIFGILGV